MSHSQSYQHSSGSASSSGQMSGIPSPTSSAYPTTQGPLPIDLLDPETRRPIKKATHLIFRDAYASTSVDALRRISDSFVREVKSRNPEMCNKAIKLLIQTESGDSPSEGGKPFPDADEDAFLQRHFCEGLTEMSKDQIFNDVSKIIANRFFTAPALQGSQLCETFLDPSSFVVARKQFTPTISMNHPTSPYRMTDTVEGAQKNLGRGYRLTYDWSDQPRSANPVHKYHRLCFDPSSSINQVFGKLEAGDSSRIVESLVDSVPGAIRTLRETDSRWGDPSINAMNKMEDQASQEWLKEALRDQVSHDYSDMLLDRRDSGIFGMHSAGGLYFTANLSEGSDRGPDIWLHYADSNATEDHEDWLSNVSLLTSYNLSRIAGNCPESKLSK
ncbi:hypothetical protein I302_107497 [Kwoniella bestiolae CBS 10118]|uniref:Uncharacterized protein n=1 Tax=Kwoniella bestiolae CBS 10118 TaxID=1296100 RepID=A0A1B9FYC2_9TREE|nr:hypothetical protein I302_06762 [Kwoniella bestiolae CBS 10118]OCF23778.1 hypothetical protein I302_06762 [Kwoniella bestiolae CBS 10118]